MAGRAWGGEIRDFCNFAIKKERGLYKKKPPEVLSGGLEVEITSSAEFTSGRTR